MAAMEPDSTVADNQQETAAATASQQESTQDDATQNDNGQQNESEQNKPPSSEKETTDKNDEKKDESNDNEKKEKQQEEEQHSVVIAGATGAIGRYCVNLCVRDPRISSVTALTRSKDGKPYEFYQLDAKQDPVNKLRHLAIDYEKDIIEQFKSYNLSENNEFTIGISAIGVYTGDVKNVDDFMAREYNPNLKIANACVKYGVKKWGYLSGGGVKMSEKKGTFQASFSWVKGCVERDLSKISEFNYVATFRPAGIVGRPSDKRLSGVLGWIEKKADKNPEKWAKGKNFIHRDDISKSMVYCLLNNDDNNGNKHKNKDNNKNYSIIIFENQDLKDKAREYENELKKLGVIISTNNNNDETNNKEKEKEKEIEKTKENVNDSTIVNDENADKDEKDDTQMNSVKNENVEATE